MNKQEFINRYGVEAYKNSLKRNSKRLKDAQEYLKFFYSDENFNGYQEIQTHFDHPQLARVIKLDPLTRLSSKNYKANHCNCEVCGQPTQCVHHKIPKAQYYRDLRDTYDMNHIDILRKINADNNLIAVCNNCHKLIHKGELNDEEV